MIRALRELSLDIAHSGHTADAEILEIVNGAIYKLEGEKPSIPDYFVASFSEAADDLGMWRGYSRKGARYAIGFPVPALNSLVSGNTYFPRELVRVRYDEEAAVREIVERFRTGIERGRTELFCGSDMTQLARSVLFRVGSSCKHLKFSGEAEWRLWFDSPSNWNFRPTNSFVVPFIRVPLDPSTSPIARVIVGPAVHRQLSRKSIEALLWKTGWGEPPVMLSEIPYRD